eukprot:747091-Hanusia_phi.AAC.8
MGPPGPRGPQGAKGNVGGRGRAGPPGLEGLSGGRGPTWCNDVRGHVINYYDRHENDCYSNRLGESFMTQQRLYACPGSDKMQFRDGVFGDPSYGVPKECKCTQGSEIGIGQCVGRSTGCQLSGNIEYWDRQSISCPDDSLISRFRAVRRSIRFLASSHIELSQYSCSDWGRVRTDYTCCSATRGLKNCRVRISRTNTHTIC